MTAVFTFISSLFWGVLTLSVLVFVHELGHFLAARACHVRVTEFFLGMPCSKNIHVVSKRTGTKIGVTPILLGGYAAICGMEDSESAYAPMVLSAIHRAGTISCQRLSTELGLDIEVVQEACAQLEQWGSIAPVYLDGDGPQGRYYPSAYAAMPRDAQGYTIYDGRAFDASHATRQGEPWDPSMGERAFYCAERSHTYAGKGFPKRVFMLVAGVVMNLLLGFALLVFVYSVIGFDVAIDSNVIGSVEESSPAAQAGLRAGDEIVSISDIETDSWTDILAAIQELSETSDEPSFVIAFERDGALDTVTLSPDDDGMVGIGIMYEHRRLGVIDAIRVSADYIHQTAYGVIQLLIPSQTMEVLDNSTSIVGISVISAQAAASGPAVYLTFASLISLSLGLMNLLPIPPLDGGKLLFEVVQLIVRRPVPAKIKNAVSYIGIALFLMLFVYMFQQDIARLI